MTGDSEVPFWIEGQPKPANQNEMPFALFYLVTSGYAPAMRIPLERGRFFNIRDDERTPVVAVIDSSFARKHFPGQDPVGKHLNIGLLDMQPEIVGVAGHVERLGSRDAAGGECPGRDACADGNAHGEICGRTGAAEACRNPCQHLPWPSRGRRCALRGARVPHAAGNR